ncbi:MAG: hemerythrin family protein [Motiliproteus sp.]
MELNKTGHTVIDMQHQRILEWFEKLQSIPANQRLGPYAKAVLDDLRNYVIEHFELEEQVMSECDFPDSVRHQHLHQQLGAQVESFVQDYESSGSLAQDLLLGFLKDWLIRHINQEDAVFSSYLEDQ